MTKPTSQAAIDAKNDQMIEFLVGVSQRDMVNFALPSGASFGELCAPTFIRLAIPHMRPIEFIE